MMGAFVFLGQDGRVKAPPLLIVAALAAQEGRDFEIALIVGRGGVGWLLIEGGALKLLRRDGRTLRLLGRSFCAKARAIGANLAEAGGDDGDAHLLAHV